MRIAKSLQDANLIFKEIFDFIDAFRTQDINLKEKRVVNASPSQKDTDYVIRKELYDLFGQTQQKQILTVSDQIEAILEQISQIKADIEAIKTRITDLETRVTALEEQSLQFDVDIADLADRVRALEGN